MYVAESDLLPDAFFNVFAFTHEAWLQVLLSCAFQMLTFVQKAACARAVRQSGFPAEYQIAMCALLESILVVFLGFCFPNTDSVLSFLSFVLGQCFGNVFIFLLVCTHKGVAMRKQLPRWCGRVHPLFEDICFGLSGFGCQLIAHITAPLIFLPLAVLGRVAPNREAFVFLFYSDDEFQRGMLFAGILAAVSVAQFVFWCARAQSSRASARVSAGRLSSCRCMANTCACRCS